MNTQPRSRASAVCLVALCVLFAVAAAPLGAQAPARPSALDDLLKQVATYNGGIESDAVWKLRDYVLAHRDDAAGRSECETKLLAFLKTTATPSAKLAAAKHLRMIAGDTAVPALQALLADDKTADLALYVLRQVPGGAADKALLQTLALPRLGTPTRIAVVAALGERRSEEAVAAIVPLLKQPELAIAAATSLGAVGSDSAAHSLVAAYPAASKELKVPMAAALLECAEKSLAAGNQAGALKLYALVATDTALPVSVRKGAAAGQLSASAPNGPAQVMAYLRGSDVEMQEVAIAKMADVIKADAVAAVGELLPNLPQASQVKLLAALSNYPSAAVLKTVLAAARSQSPDVRLAAIDALQRVGDASTVSLLAQAAAAGKGSEQVAARSALGLLKGRAVDAEILSLIAKKQADDVQGELILAVAERRMYPAKTVVADALGSPSQKLRVQALRAMRALGSYSDVPAVLDVLVKATDDSEQSEAAGATAALAQKVNNLEGRASAVTARLNIEKGTEARVRLIAVLPTIGDPATFPALRRLVNDREADVADAAVRAFCSWPTAAAREDVMRLARDSRAETHRLLAIAGLVRLIGLDKYRDRQAAVADLRQAAGFAWRPEEQKLVLAALPPFACQEALDLASSYLREPSVKAEAQAAVNKINERLAAMKKATT